jgi:hypothetical protein
VPGRKHQALEATYSPRARRRRTAADHIGTLFVGGLVLLALGLGGAKLYDRARQQEVRPRMMQDWPRAKGVLEHRLQQGEPLEFGAVWATHAGLFCGLVNGRHSFSGLAGMTPFVVDGGKAAFALDQTALAFAPVWRACMTDKWITVIDGSMQAGGCATELGQRRCVTVRGE